MIYLQTWRYLSYERDVREAVRSVASPFSVAVFVDMPLPNPAALLILGTELTNLYLSEHYCVTPQAAKKRVRSNLSFSRPSASAIAVHVSRYCLSLSRVAAW
jgi:GTP:adenosylcobinamide-phosphate guanylyltransferase